MKVQEKLKINLNSVSSKSTFQVIILHSSKNKMLNEDILGRRFVDWIAYACEGFNIKVIDYDNEKILDLAKNIVDETYTYTIFLFASTPLIDDNCIKRICEYSQVKKIKVCKLPVGYVVNNKFVKESSQIFVDSLYSQDLDLFYIVENKKQLKHAYTILQDRINSFHMSNNVEIKSPSSVHIEPEVDIEENVVICSGNVLKGNTKLKQNIILKENNIIENTFINVNSCIAGSVINNSKIGENVYISNFSEIKNCTIEDDVIIPSGCKLYNLNIKSGMKLNPNEVLGEDNDSDSWTWKSR